MTISRTLDHAAPGDTTSDPINPDLAKLLEAAGLNIAPTTGRGAQLVSKDGDPILDMIPGYGAAPLGHGPTSVTETVANVLGQDMPNLVQPEFSNITRMLARRLQGLAPMEVDRVHFATTGSESVEIALNSARLATDRLRFIAAVNGSHGKSVGGLSVTYTEEDNQFAQLAGTIFVPFGDIDAMAEALEEDGDTIAAVILEPIQAFGGVHLPPEGYLQQVRALCDTHGVILIFDEIFTGIGRTGHLFATEWTGVEPDMLLLGKALGGGAMPISACLFGPRARTKSLFFQHMSMHVGSVYAATAANAMLDNLLANDRAMIASIARLGTELAEVHARLCRAFPALIKEMRGKGLLHGIEFAPSTRVRSGGHGAVLELARAMDKLPELVTGNLLSRGVRVAPAG
ncbi:MAG: aminotransferase class III-fold pyridoxal phosphate-dependent enzyme, partial [Pseudomonadota bacterium]